VVGHGDGRHPELLDVLDELIDVASAVEHGIVGVQVKMDELGHVTCLYCSGWRTNRHTLEITGVVWKLAIQACIVSELYD
jgi:hypothetical protein